MAGADLLITDDRCRNTWTIQVKVTDATHRRRRGWLIGHSAKLTACPTHAYVFVMLKDDGCPDFYVVPKAFVATHQKVPARRIGGPVEENLDLRVISARRIVRHPAARLEMEILQIVAGPLPPRSLG
jgi:hypothetical protein